MTLLKGTNAMPTTLDYFTKAMEKFQRIHASVYQQTLDITISKTVRKRRRVQLAVWTRVLQEMQRAFTDNFSQYEQIPEQIWSDKELWTDPDPIKTPAEIQTADMLAREKSRIAFNELVHTSAVPPETKQPEREIGKSVAHKYYDNVKARISVLQNAGADNGKFAIEIGKAMGTPEESEAFDRMIDEGWLRFVDVILAVPPGRSTTSTFRVFKMSDVAQRWLHMQLK
jgi:hypothetical protein